MAVRIAKKPQRLAHRERTMRSRTEQLLFLRQVSIFRGMTFEQLERLTVYLEKRRFLAGEVIYRQGDTGQHFYLVVSGRVRVVKDYGKPTERHITYLKSRDFFGEMGIFEDKPHAATLIASQDTCVLTLAAPAFKRLIAQHPSIALEMGRELSARIRRSSAPDRSP
jgi:CRP/FNR family transcriptional regulator